MNWNTTAHSVVAFLYRHAMIGWMIQVFLVVFAAMVINAITIRLLKRFVEQATKTKNIWDDALLRAAQKPLPVLIWVIGIGFAGDIILRETGTTLFTAISPLRTVGVIGSLVWFVVRFVFEIEDGIVAHRRTHGVPVDLTTVKAVGRLVRASVLITGVLIGLQSLGFSVSGVLAFGGIGGIAIGFAARDILANFFGGLMLYLDRPFAVGDWISSPDRDIEGTVEDIGWRLTRIRRFDKRPVYIPNSLFATMAVVNPSRMSHRRIFETIGIRYDDLAIMGAIVESVKTMLHKREDIDATQTLMVYFTAFNQSSCDFIIYCFTHTTVWSEYLATKQDVLLCVADIIEAHHAEIAFPTRTLHIATPMSSFEESLLQNES